MRSITVRGFSQTIFSGFLLALVFLFSSSFLQAFPSSLYVGAFGEYPLDQETSANPDLGVYGQYNNRVFLYERDYLSLTGAVSLSDVIHSIEDSAFAEAVYVKHLSSVNLSVGASVTHSFSQSRIIPSWEVGVERKQKRKVIIPFLTYGGSFNHATNTDEDSLTHTASLGLSYSPRLERSYRVWTDLIYDEFTDSQRKDLTSGIVYEMSGFLGYLSTWETMAAFYYHHSTEETAQKLTGSLEGDISWSPTKGLTLAFAPEFVLSRALADNSWVFTTRASSSADFIITNNLFAYLSASVSLFDPDRDLFTISGGVDVRIL
jgi:hypothetical protein